MCEFDGTWEIGILVNKGAKKSPKIRPFVRATLESWYLCSGKAIHATMAGNGRELHVIWNVFGVVFARLVLLALPRGDVSLRFRFEVILDFPQDLTRTLVDLQEPLSIALDGLGVDFLKCDSQGSRYCPNLDRLPCCSRISRARFAFLVSADLATLRFDRQAVC